MTEKEKMQRTAVYAYESANSIRNITEILSKYESCSEEGEITVCIKRLNHFVEKITSYYNHGFYDVDDDWKRVAGWIH